VRVLHIVSGKLYGGVEATLVRRARCRDLCPEMQPEFAVCSAGRLSQELEAAGAPVYYLGETRVRYPLSVARARRRLKKLFAERRFDVVICHLAWAHAIFASTVRAAGLPLIRSFHDANFRIDWLERWAQLTPPDLAVCSSKFTMRAVHALYPSMPIEVAYNPVSATDPRSLEGARSAMRSELGTADDAVVIIQVSRLESWKGHTLHLEALGMLRDVPGWVCWQVGGPQREREVTYLRSLELKAAELGIADRVRFVGQRSDVARLMAAADIFCQPNSEAESFGTVFVEALISGLPVVSTRIGGAIEIVDQTCGRLVEPGNVRELAATLRELIADPSMRGNLGNSGPRRAADLCDPRLQLHRLHDSLQRVLDAHDARRSPHRDASARAALARDAIVNGRVADVAHRDDAIRVLHLVSGKLYGGVETMLTTLARNRALCARMQPEFGICFEGRLADELDAAHASVHRLGQVRVRYPLSVLRARRRLQSLIAERRFDVVICHLAWAHAIFASTVRAAGLPLVFWVHGPFAPGHWLERWAHQTIPDLALCNSKFTLDMLREAFPGARSDFLYYPISPADPGALEDSRAAIRAELHTDPDATVIVQTSRMEPWKGHALHLEALGSLRKVPGWICWQVGGPQRSSEARYFESLKQQAARLGISGRVRFAGQRADVPRLLSAADIFCQPNAGPEPFGIAFVEALAAGLPVITTRVGAANEVVGESCGILVPPGDLTALAAALKSLITNPRARRALAAMGPARAHELTDPAQQLGKLADLLADRISSRRYEAAPAPRPEPLSTP
jgi:glycosyltransferase involved in cell wall biosynthesis